MNQKHLHRLVREMYKVQDFPALDEYGSKIFGRPIRGSWKLFRHITRFAVGGAWSWSPVKELASYPKRKKVLTFEEFATFMLHETTHGWCYFLKNDSLSRSYLKGVDEEQVCWDVSEMVCNMLDISYQEKLANLCYRFHVRALTHDTKELCRILKKLPAHLRT